jgi:excisionase family DNA binding protein
MPSHTATRRERVSIAAAAEHLGVSERSIRRWIAEGLLPAYRVGPTLIRLDLDDVDKLARRIPTGGDAA